MKTEEESPELTQEEVELTQEYFKLTQEDVELTQGNSKPKQGHPKPKQGHPKPTKEYPKLTQEEYAFLVDTISASEDHLHSFIAAELRSENCGNKDLEEILSKVYDTAYMRFDKLYSSPNPIGWLTVVARYKLMTYFRDSKRVVALESMELLSNSRDEIYLGLEEFFTKKIKQSDRDLLIRRIIFGDRVKKIASDLNEKEGTIKKRIRVAKDKMRHILRIK